MYRFSSKFHARLTRIQTGRNRLLGALSLLLLVTLLAGACRPGIVGAPTPAPVKATPTSRPGQSEPTRSVDIDVIDNGEPLPPQVIERHPAGSQELALDGRIRLVFDQPMDEAATGEALQITGPDGEPVAGRVSWEDTRTLQFAASRPLESGATYLARLTTDAASAGGAPLADELSWQFDTAGSLAVSQAFPTEDARDVEPDAVITVIFNRPVVPLVIAEDRQNLPDPLEISPPIAGRGEWVNTSVYAFHPEQPLQSGSAYRLRVPAGLSDAAGESSLQEAYTWSFTTAAPAIQWLSRSSGEVVNIQEEGQSVLLDEFFHIRFLQSMDPAGTEAAISLTSRQGEPVRLTTEWNEDATQVTITPTIQLALNTTYNLSLSTAAQAADGGGLRQGLEWSFTTVPYPSVLAVVPGEGQVQNYYDPMLAIQFVSPMNLESVKQRIEISPAPEEPVEWWYRSWDWSVAAFVLKPSTEYTVRLLPGMQDIYGNLIREGTTVQFSTAAYEPEAGLQMPYEPVLVRTGGPESFYAAYRNVSGIDLSLYRLTAEQFTDILSGRPSQWEYRPQEDQLIWQDRAANRGGQDQRVQQKFNLQARDGGSLENGFYFLAIDAPEVRHQSPFADTRLVVVADANLTFKSSSTGALIWLTGLDSGEPIPDVPVTVYDAKMQPVGQGATGEDGLLVLEGLPAPDDPYEPRYVMTGEDAQAFGFASSQWGSGVSLYDFGLWSSYYAPTNRPRAYVYSDRPIYRPGQPVYFKGILRMEDDLDYSLPSMREVNVTIDSYDETVYEETLPLSEFGTFDGELTLDSEAALGVYELLVRSPEGDEVIGSLSINVAEYRRPEFQVEVGAAQSDVLAGDTFTVDVTADYYSGGGVSEANVGWTLSSAPYTFEPGGDLASYSFTDFEDDLYFYNRGNQPDSSEIIAEGQAQTDGEGRLQLELPADLSEEQTSRRLTLEANVSDLSGNLVSGRDGVTVHRSEVYAGIRAGAYVGQAGKQQNFQLVTVDWSAEPLPEHPVTVEVVERRWYSVQEQDPQGRVSWTSSVEEIPVASFEDLVTDSNGELTVSFTPPNGGVFRARVRAMDEFGNLASASAYMWVAGEDYVPWRQTDDRSFNLVSDRESYAPGDTAELLIASPFQGPAYALVTVERGHVREQEVIRLAGNSEIYPLKIRADMAPNVYVSVLIVKGIDENNLRPNFKMGMAELQVETRQQELDVELIPDREQAGPGEQVTYAVLTRDAQGDPVQAEVSLGLSDLATLSLSPPNAPPILDYFYDHRSLSVWTAVPIFLSLEDFNVALDESAADKMPQGSGGKGGLAMGVVEIRQDFPDTAYWEAHLITDENGEATVTVRLPDNLTTWRMDARAVTADTRVGQTSLDIISTRPLLIRPQTPRFFVAGDRVWLGAALHNNTDQAMSVEAGLQAEGLELMTAAKQQVEIPARRQVYVTWDAVTPEAAADGSPLERVDMVFQAAGVGADGAEYSDATRPTLSVLEGQGLPVYRYQAPETVGASGQLLEAGSLVEAVSLPPSMETGAGTLTVRLSPSLAASMTDALDYLEHYPYECIEQTISRFLPNVMTAQALQAAGLSDPDLEANLETQISTALQRLYNGQNPDGGWGWWSGQKSDPLTSAYVVMGLIEAQRAGYGVSDEVLNNGIRYLKGRLRSLSSVEDPQVASRQAFILYVLARADQPDVSKTVQLYELRRGLPLYARAYLLETFWRIDPEDPRLGTLRSDLSSAAIVSATGTHWEEEQQDPWNWNTDTRTTAIILSALSQIEPQNPLNANAVRWLMSHRTDGHWYSTQETAWSIMALTNWMVQSGELEASYEYALALNGERRGEGVATQDTLRETMELRFDVAGLLRDVPNRLAIARTEGPGSLYYTTHLEIDLPVEEIDALDQGIVVSRSYYRQDDPETPIMQAAQGEILLARLTVVAPQSLHYLVVNDPLPAGLEAIDPNLEISPQAEQPDNYTWDDLWRRGWGWWYFNHIQMRDERLVLSADYLPAGTYTYAYLVRAGTAGEFQTIPPTAQEFYFPEVYGRGEGMLFVVQP